ncbi:FAD-dependent oxidoreductase [Burkholderia alba]|uniref:FAD-dependent oxidoreductase n=1 Tax=Burkholderia alba TaxID=2683677 RepID=UPI002B05F325|nr:FAD-dependent monooxygenase [Burkholderia alba]
MPSFHVAIVGAGLGGLCLAQGLKRAGIAFDVYERDAAPQSRTQGYRIRIDEAGQRALAHCLPDDLYALFRHTCAAAASAGRFVDPRLAALDGRAADTWQPAATGPEAAGDLSAHRLTLREILLHGISAHVHFGKAFAGYAIDADRQVAVHFSDGELRRTSLLVAADGVHSTVRRRALPNAEPAPTGAICVYGQTPLTPELRAVAGADLGTGTSVIFADGFAAVLDAMRFRAPFVVPGPAFVHTCGLTHVDDYLYWAFIGPDARLPRIEPAGTHRTADVWLNSVAHWTRDWHPRVRKLLRHATPDSLALQPVRRAPDLGTLPAGPLAFIGDAIHAMSPAAGLGANTALADAADLAGRLAQARAAGAASWSGALRDYHAALRTRANAALQAADRASDKLFGAQLAPS